MIALTPKLNYIRRLICLLCLLGSVAQAEPNWVLLTWESDPCRSMLVQWADESEVPGKVQYRSEKEQAWHTIDAELVLLPDQKTKMKRASLSKLEPGKTYQFRLPDGTEHRFRTLPSSLTGTKLRCAVAGDIYNGKDNRFKKSCRMAAKRNPQLMLWGGDLAYAATSSAKKPQNPRRWNDFLRISYQNLRSSDDYLIPVLATVGNHDTSGRYLQNPSKAPWFYALFPIWQKANGYHVIDIGDYLSIFVLDSDHTHPVDGQQSQWLRRELAQRKSRPHKVALYHVPAYPSHRQMDNEHSERVRKHWTPIFDELGLDVAFEHHDHTYKRTHPLLNGEPSEEGVVYMGDGCFAVDARSVKAARKHPWLAASSKRRNFILMTLTADERRLQGCSVSDAHTFDEYIQKLQ